MLRISFGALVLGIYTSLLLFSSLVSSAVPVYKHGSGGKDFSKWSLVNLRQEDLKLRFEGRELKFNSPVFEQTNRYYLPLEELVAGLHGKLTRQNETINIFIDSLSVAMDVKHHTYRKGSRDFSLRNHFIEMDKQIYISLFDFCRMLDLKSDWDLQHHVIALYWNREPVRNIEPITSGRPALLRLEDIAPGHLYTRPEGAEKLRIIADYLYSQNIPFHVAWVPRYVDPKTKLDNDLLKQHSMPNVDFVFTLDYLLDRNGVIGLHGYTHQYGNTESVVGAEFHSGLQDKIPEDSEYVRERVKAAKNCAVQLDIPYAFFEVPHYAINLAGLEVLEKEFAIIYQGYPGVPGKVWEKTNGSQKTKYVPTPLGYLNGKNDLPRMEKAIDTLPEESLASFFYHPFIEFSDIKLIKGSNGYPTYIYSDSSPLHKLMKIFRDKRYKFVTIDKVFAQ